MINGLVPFSYQGQDVRVITRDGMPWWVARDVCDVLGLKNITTALRDLDPDELSQVSLPDVGSNEGRSLQRRQYITVSESGLYAVVIQSRKPAAKQFRKWITNEVLPSIRKTGTYNGLEGIALDNYNHALTADEYWLQHGSQHEDGRLRHLAGRTYVVWVSDHQFKIGQSAGKTKGKDLYGSILGRICRQGYGPIIKVITGGWTREQELFCKLSEFRTNEGVDYFIANDDSLNIIHGYQSSHDAPRIERAFNRWWESHRKEITP